MGLLYIMPKNKKEITQVEYKTQTTKIKTYPLPSVFWLYFLIVCIITFTMLQVSLPLISKLLNSEDTIDTIIAMLTILALAIIPLAGLIFLFYKKEIIIFRSKESIQIKSCVFSVPFHSKKIDIKALEIKHFLSSPNMAKIQDSPSTKAFENRGHFLLEAIDKKGNKYLIDRHTNKADLVGLKNLIEECLV